MLESLNLSTLLPLYAPLIMFGIFFWGILDVNLLLKRDGKIKRGVFVWSEDLTPEMRTFFENLTGDIIEEEEGSFWKAKSGGFILVENREILIQYRKRNWRTAWPYVGYVNLEAKEPELEYRTSLPMLLFLLPFVVGILVNPAVLLVLIAFMGINHWNEKNTILNYVNQHARGHHSRDR